MADYDWIAKALEAQRGQYAENDPWVAGYQGLAAGSQAIDYSQMDPWQAALASALIGVGTGYTKGKAKSSLLEKDADFSSKLTKALQSDDVVAALMGDQELSRFAPDYQAEMLRKRDLEDERNKKLEDRIAELGIQSALQRGQKGGEINFQRGEDGNLSWNTGTQGQAPVAPIEEATRSGGPTSIDEKVVQDFRRLVAEGVPPGQAMESARALNAGELNVLKTFEGDINKTREQSNRLRDLAMRGESLTNAAGKTGRFGEGLYEQGARILAGFGDADQRQKLSATEGLDALSADTFALNRVVGTGAVSDTELRMYLKGGFSSGNLPETNIRSARKLESLAEVADEYANFQEAYLQKNGTLQGAGQAWQEIRKQTPFFTPTEDGDVQLDMNAVRSWRTALDPSGPQNEAISRALGGETLPVDMGGGVPQGNQGAQGEAPIPPGFRRLRNKRTGEYKDVPL